MLRLDGVKVAFEDAAGKTFEALSVPELVAEPGSLSVIVGPSGSGKSTLLHAIAGILPLTSGGIRWNTEIVSALPEVKRDQWRRETVGYIFQDFQLIPELTPLQNVSLAASFGRNRMPRDRGEALLAEFDVPASRRRTFELSRGEQQRVAFARALYFDPPIILADEATASLDAKNAEAVIAALAGLAANGKTVIAASHDNALIGAAHRRLRLDHGRLSEARGP